MELFGDKNYFMEFFGGKNIYCLPSTYLFSIRLGKLSNLSAIEDVELQEILTINLHKK